MDHPDQLAIEIRYIPLPADELEERKARFYILLLRGALRLVRQELPGIPAPTEAYPAEISQK